MTELIVMPRESALGTREIGQQYRLLIVEDDPDTGQGLRWILRNWGYQARLAETGEAALEIIAEALPDLILLDLGLPGKDGLELLELFRSDEATRRVPVIVLSAWSRDRVERLALDAGASVYIQKPDTDGQLHSVIQRLLNPV